MNVSAPFVRRPIATVLVMLALVLFGIVGYRELPVAPLPNVDFPTIQVNAALPGASPETMAASVATPLEKQFSTIAGLRTMNSVSSLGQTQITLQFDLARDLDGAALDVQSAISAAQRQLPAEMPSPPSFRKTNPAQLSDLILAVSSDTVPIWAVDGYAETTIGQRLSMVNGVAQVSVFGPGKYAVRIRLDPDRLAARALGIDEVRAAVSSHNVNLPGGTLWGAERNAVVQASGQLTNAYAYRGMVVAYRDGAPVRLGELGEVSDSIQDVHSGGFYNGRPAVILGVQRQPGANTIAVVDAVKQLLPQLEAQLPAGVKVDVVYDRTETIRASVRDVQLTLLAALALVVATVFAFLRNVRATVIPSLALPIAVAGSFAFMALLGYSLDNLSLMALTLCVGFIVDDAIVVLENIVRHMESGKDALTATLDGAAEIGFTVVSMTLSLAAVFIPILFMGGILGRLLREFGMTIIIVVLLSGLVSLTLTPMLASRFLRRVRPAHRGRFHGLYARTLGLVMRHRRATMALFAAVFAATAWLALAAPKSFLPGEDAARIAVNLEGPQDASFERMSAASGEAAQIIRADPAVDSVTYGLSSSQLNQVRMNVQLKPQSERDDIAAVIARLRPKLAGIPDVKPSLQNPPLLQIGGLQSRSLYQLTLQDSDTSELYRWAPLVLERARQVPGLADVSSDLQIATTQARIDIDRDKADALGVTPQQIEAALYAAYGSQQVSTIYAPSDQYWVIMELAPQYQRDMAALARLYVRSSGGKLVPLDTLTRVSTGVAPLTVNHFGQLPSVTISFNLAPGASLGEAIDGVNAALAALHMPKTVVTGFQGTAQAFQESLAGMGWLIVLAVAVIYIVLGVLYESVVHPVTILSGLPTAGFGALVTLLLLHMQLDLYAGVGILVLIGIVKKNAIMMIDFALEAQRRDGKPAKEAIVEACLVRFRPIMMTTVAAIMGALPIALGLGAGGASRQPLGVAVVGGLLVSQLMTLYITPVVYLYLERWAATAVTAPKSIRNARLSQ